MELSDVQRETIYRGECWTATVRKDIEAAFRAYSGLEGLRGPFYLGAESHSLHGAIANEFPLDDPKHGAFKAGYACGKALWGD